MKRILLLAALATSVFAEPPARTPRFHIPFWNGSADAPERIQANLNGVPARVLDVRKPGEDLIILLAIDLTESLSLADPAKEALVEQLSKLPPKTLVAVMRAQDGLSVLLDPGADVEQLADAVRKVPVSGKAGFLETVEQLSAIGDSILTKTRVRTATLFITDSDISNYREDFTNPVINTSDSSDLSRRFPEGLVQDKIIRLTSRMATGQTPLFVVHLDYRSDRLNEAYQNGIKKLAESTGGFSAFCRSIADIPSSIQDMFGRIYSQYILAIELPSKPKKALAVSLTVEGPGQGNLSYRPQIVVKE
jgi:hypothetical protein